MVEEAEQLSLLLSPSFLPILLTLLLGIVVATLVFSTERNWWSSLWTTNPGKPSSTTTTKNKKRRGAVCPFTAETSFIVETATDLPDTPLDLFEDWDRVQNDDDDDSSSDYKPMAARWLNAGISGQDTPRMLRAGLKRMRDQKWFLVQDKNVSNFCYELGLKKKAYDDPRRFPKVYVQEDDSVKTAQMEVLQLFLHYLPLRYPDYYDYDKRAHTITVKPLQETFRIQDYAARPLELCARIVQEDLVLMRPPRPLTDTSNAFAMAAAAVVFSFSELAQKLSKPVEWIHAPVPGYERQLRKTLDLTFGKLLKIEQPMWRNNWAIAPSGQLDEPIYGTEEATANRQLQGKPTVAELESKFLKVEYQTIRRLPQSGYLLFTVRTMADGLGELRKVPVAAHCLAKSIRGMSPAMQAYKGINNAETCEAVLEYLEGSKFDGDPSGVLTVNSASDESTTSGEESL